MSDETKQFEYNAPKFLDFTISTTFDDGGADKFFDTDYDAIGHLPESNTEVCNTENEISQPIQIDQINSTANLQSSESKVQPTPESTRDVCQLIVPCSLRDKKLFAPSIEITENENGESTEKVVMVEVAHQGVQVVSSKHVTKIEPFSFDERHRRMLEKKEEKIRKILEEEKKMREFHANPVPDFSHPLIHNNTSVTVTKTQDIRFRTEKRIEERHKRDRSCNSDKEENKYSFKARPATVLQKPPFEPKKPECPLTDVTGIHLNTEERAKKREEFNTLIKQKIADHDMVLAQRKQEEERQATQQVKRMRETAVHKAAPVPRKILEQPYKVLPSSMPLTEPKTPKLGPRKRSHQDD